MMRMYGILHEEHPNVAPPVLQMAKHSVKGDGGDILRGPMWIVSKLVRIKGGGIQSLMCETAARNTS